eukprot:767506-Hanusia_phi.AAC.7
MSGRSEEVGAREGQGGDAAIPQPCHPNPAIASPVPTNTPTVPLDSGARAPSLPTPSRCLPSLSPRARGTYNGTTHKSLPEDLLMTPRGQSAGGSERRGGGRGRFMPDPARLACPCLQARGCWDRMSDW